MKAWERILFEYAVHPDPMAAHMVSTNVVGMTVEDRVNAICHLLRRGYIEVAGRVMIDEQLLDIYRISAKGRAYWSLKLDGIKKRPKKAQPAPRWTLAQMTAAQYPTSVFDLDRAPVNFGKWKDRPGQNGYKENPWNNS